MRQHCSTQRHTGKVNSLEESTLNDILTIQEPTSNKDFKTTIIHTSTLNRGPIAVGRPNDAPSHNAPSWKGLQRPRLNPVPSPQALSALSLHPFPAICPDLILPMKPEGVICGSVQWLLEITMTSTDHFQLLNSRLDRFKHLGSQPGPIGFLGQEALRFYSIAGTLKANEMVNDTSVDVRYISHILARSLIENFFWMVYIFDDPANRQSRYEELITSFKRQYGKFYDEDLLINSQLEPPGQGWSQLPSGLDVRSMISQVSGDHGQQLDRLYAIYRITSFDTHGKSLDNISESAHGHPGLNFPVLNLVNCFDVIANEYLSTLSQLEGEGIV